MAKDSEEFDRRSLSGEGKMTVEVKEEPSIADRLKPGGEIHGKLISELQGMIRSSEQHIAQRYDDWDRVDEQCRLYLDLERKENLGDGSEGDKKKMPYKESIAVPIIYSTIMTRVAVLFSQLTQRFPRVHLEPRESGDFEGARIHEALIQYDVEQTEFDLQVWQGLYDQERYGLAIWYDTWEEEWGKPKRRRVSLLDAMLNQAGSPVADQEVVKQWNNISTVDPRDFRPDPNVPISQVQDMNYVGHKDYANYLWYHERQLENKTGPFFNLEIARKMVHGGDNTRNTDGRWMQGTYQDNNPTEYPNMPVAHIQWKIIPKEWKLSEAEHPEIWWFSVLDNGGAAVILRAHPSVYDHGKFSYSVSQPDRDAHAPFVPGMGQQLIGLQDMANWLVNSHLVNARKIINDQIIYNDDLIDSVDMANPGPAKHIRLTRRGKRLHEMGQLRIQDMYGQFAIGDITKSHLETVQFLWPQAQRMAATPDTIQGMPLPTKRTLGEVESVNQSATMRLGQDAVMFDRQLIAPTADRWVKNRQQFSNIDTVVRISGRILEQLKKLYPDQVSELERGILKISPDDLRGGYDYIVHTPTMAPDPARQAMLWMQMLQMLGSAPQLLNPDPLTGEAIDPHAVFDEAIRNSGIDYIDRFKKIIQPMPGQAGPGQMPPDQPAAGGIPGMVSPEQIDKSVQSGNMV